MTTADLRQLDRRYLWHPFTHMKLWLEDDASLVIVAGEGCELIDSDGRRYLDGVSSLWCNVHGHRVPEIDAAIVAQLQKIAHSTLLGLSNEPAILLAERLIQIAPLGLAKVFYASDGASATEIAFKLAVQYWWNLGRPQKTEFVGFVDAYHGDTVGAMSVGHSEAFHRPYAPLLFKTHYIDARAPNDSPVKRRDSSRSSPDEILARVEYVLTDSKDHIAAICIEPLIMGAAGMIVHPKGLLKGLRDLATKHDVLLIVDEVATGFGRTGTMFACEQEGVTPDLLCAGKGLTGGYLPLSATLATQKIFDAFLGDPHEGKTFFHGHTFTGNPLACAAGIANLDLFRDRAILERARLLIAECSALLQSIAALPHVGEIRQCGLMIGIDLVADRVKGRPFDPRQRVGAEVCKRLRARGVILRPLGDTIVVMPPVGMSVAQARMLFNALHAEIESLRAEDSVSESPGNVVSGDY